MKLRKNKKTEKRKHLNKMEELQAENILLISDTHTLDFVGILDHYKLKNFILVHCGDVGIGFASYYKDMKKIAELDDYCRADNGRILVCRGNHDLPSAFIENSPYNTEFVKFLPDYTYKVINGKVFLFAGGAVSIDRQLRTEGIDYWKDEGFFLPKDYQELPQCDVLITHCPPQDAMEYEDLNRISGWFKNDPTLKEELLEERRLIRKLSEHSNTRCVFYGHMHITSSIRVDATWFRGLNINEVLDITRDI